MQLLPQTGKAQSVTPQPLNTHIGQSLFGNGTIERQKKNHASATLLLAIFAKFDKSNVAEA